MSSGCTGLWGKLLGHKFVEYCVEDDSNPSPTKSRFALSMGEKYTLTRIEKFRIKCSRCGVEWEEKADERD